MGIESRFDGTTAEVDRVGGIPQSWRGEIRITSALQNAF